MSWETVRVPQARLGGFQAGSRQWIGFDLTASLYFPEAYSQQLHMSVLRGVSGLVDGSILTLWPTDLPTVEVTMARVGDTDVRGQPMEILWDERELEGVIGRSYVQYVNFNLKGSGRPVTVMTFLYDDANVLFDLDFRLNEEESSGEGPFIPEDIGESRLLDVIDRIDPFWAVVSVEGMAPDVQDFLERGLGKFWYGNVYLGSTLTRRVGLSRLREAVRDLASVAELGRGGIYLSWTPPHKWPDPRYEPFVSLLRKGVQYR